MTRKDYIAIASALRYRRDDIQKGWKANYAPHQAEYLAELGRVSESIATVFERDNPRFDAAHFLAVVRGERELTSRPPRRDITSGGRNLAVDYIK